MRSERDFFSFWKVGGTVHWGIRGCTPLCQQSKNISEEMFVQRKKKNERSGKYWDRYMLADTFLAEIRSGQSDPILAISDTEHLLSFDLGLTLL